VGSITRDQDQVGTTGKPAVIYVPRGVYILQKPIQLWVGTVLMGDPLSPPTFKAGSNFKGNTMIFGKDPHRDSTTNFYIAIKNMVFDSNNINKDTTFNILEWSVSQATQLTNCVFNMPDFSGGHTGITMPEGGSGTYMGDLQINGGAVGINMGNQQYIIKGVTFARCTTAIKISHCFDCIFQSCSFSNHDTAIDMTPGNNNVGSVIVLDSSANNVGSFVKTVISGSGQNSLILENIQNTGTGNAKTVITSSSTILSGNVADTWVMGNTVSVSSRRVSVWSLIFEVCSWWSCHRRTY
jgi:glucan 1,3-beta-glucosidase